MVKYEIEIEFFDREREKREIIEVLKAKPDLVNFVFGPINSGKTELILNLINGLNEDYVAFYINLRWIVLSNYKDFANILFSFPYKEFEKELRKSLSELIASGIKIFSGIPIPTKILDHFIKEREISNVFEYLINIFEDISKKDKKPILILDELQKLKDINVDGSLLYELFNFFVGLEPIRKLQWNTKYTKFSFRVLRVFRG